MGTECVRPKAWPQPSFSCSCSGKVAKRSPLLVLSMCCAHRLTEPCTPAGRSQPHRDDPWALFSCFSLPGKARVHRIGHERQGCISLTRCNL
jgi:hypothetical protein